MQASAFIWHLPFSIFTHAVLSIIPACIQTAHIDESIMQFPSASLSHDIIGVPHSILFEEQLSIPVSPPLTAIYGAITNDTIDINLIRMFIEGPEVSLNGSPTVSPVTEALCGSDFL